MSNPNQDTIDYLKHLLEQAENGLITSIAVAEFGDGRFTGLGVECCDIDRPALFDGVSELLDEVKYD